MTLEVEKINPYDNSSEKKTQIESMFDNIAGKYDFLNRLLSLGIDVLWRKYAIRQIEKIQPKLILDMATGTGDFAIEATKIKDAKVIGVDLSQNMLDIGIQKVIAKNLINQIEYIKGDSEQLNFETNQFDAITVGFGVRNFQNIEKGLKELHRVMKPNGMIAILEPSFPTNPIVKALFNIHFRYITPWVGKFFSKDASAYSYLPNSVEAFAQGEDFCKLMRECGYRDTKFTPLTFGICTLYTATK